MNSITIQINAEDIARIKRDFLLMDQEVPIAQSRVINRTLTAVNSEAVVQVRKHYNLTATRVRKNFSIRKATINNLSGSWHSRGEPVGLVQFGARQIRRGVSVKVTTSSSRETVDHAFIQIGKNSLQHVFWREKKNGIVVPRYAMHRLTGPRIEDALAKPDVQKALQKTADETLQKRLEAEASFILSRAQS